MAKNQNERIKMNNIDDIEIFGAHKTREQIKAEEKARKQAEREALRREMEARRTARAKGEAPRRFDTWTVVMALAFIVVLGAVAIAMTVSQTAEQEKFMLDESRDVWLGNAVEPQANKLDGAATRAYFTRGGYLTVQISLTNTSATAQQFKDVTVTVYTDETCTTTVAQGYTEIPNEMIVPAGGTDTYTVHIAPEHILLKDAPLTTACIAVEVNPN